MGRAPKFGFVPRIVWLIELAKPAGCWSLKTYWFRIQSPDGVVHRFCSWGVWRCQSLAADWESTAQEFILKATWQAGHYSIFAPSTWPHRNTLNFDLSFLHSQGNSGTAIKTRLILTLTWPSALSQNAHAEARGRTWGHYAQKGWGVCGSLLVLWVGSWGLVDHFCSW
jgi:hypothetical protein